MDENLRRIHQYVEHITEELEKTILLASNVFCHLEQAVYRLTANDPAGLTADEYRARERQTAILINRLQEHRKVIKHLMEFYDVTMSEVENSNHPTLLHRLEKDIKWKIRDLLYKVLYKELLVDIYQVKLELRQNMSNFARSE
ncbi:hypothetical protein CEXT_802101 [Caerostris extrusa]|uniref:Uncharacterized protein n=1 Tax=Caerostris extrusa TaxID=172846 RepID=A0AAV4T696_CAEEX|nr:hypothetical protein CEXT_802101 [Caerostris extrusa]